jgi:hypothetical protein
MRMHCGMPQYMPHAVAVVCTTEAVGAEDQSGGSGGVQAIRDHGECRGRWLMHQSRMRVLARMHALASFPAKASSAAAPCHWCPSTCACMQVRIGAQQQQYLLAPSYAGGSGQIPDIFLAQLATEAVGASATGGLAHIAPHARLCRTAATTRCEFLLCRARKFGRFSALTARATWSARRRAS